MAHAERSSSVQQNAARSKVIYFLSLRFLFFVFFQVAQGCEQSFIQADATLRVFTFEDGDDLQRESGIPSFLPKRSSSPQRSGRPLTFEPAMLDFHQQPVGMSKVERVYLHNLMADEVTLLSVAATSAHFHASFFHSQVIPPGGKTWFEVVFLARVVGNAENTLFINTSDHGVLTYQVFGVGVPNPYRLRPYTGVNNGFSPLTNRNIPYTEALQVVEVYSSGGDLHLELPTGPPGGAVPLWDFPPCHLEADKHKTFLRVRTNSSDPEQVVLMPMEMDGSAVPGIFTSVEMLEYGTLRSQDKPKKLNLHLLNSGVKDVQITSIRAVPSNEAVSVDFKPVTLRARERTYSKVASVLFDASRVQRSSQSSGVIAVKVKDKAYPKLEIPYRAKVLHGHLGLDPAVTLFHLRASEAEGVVRAVHLTNNFLFPLLVQNISLSPEALPMFQVQNFSQPVLVGPQASRYVFSVRFSPLQSSTVIDTNLLLLTNASKFLLPLRAYTGLLQAVALPPSLQEGALDFGLLSSTERISILLVVLNYNPVEVVVREWQVTGVSVSVELLRMMKTDKSNRAALKERAAELHNASASTQTTVILASSYSAVFRVTLSAKDLKGPYATALHIHTDYEILKVPVRAFVAVGTLTSSPEHIVLPPSFPGKTVHHSLSLVSSFSQKLRLLDVDFLWSDQRFSYRRLETSWEELEPNQRSKVVRIYFDASLQCGNFCYCGVPFIIKGGARPSGVWMQKDWWQGDMELYQTLRRRWITLVNNNQHVVETMLEMTSDLQRSVRTRVSARLGWPSIIHNATRHFLFPLTPVNGFSEVEMKLENPSDRTLFVQVLPLALYPNLPLVINTLSEQFPLERLVYFSPDTLEFQIHQNQTSENRKGSMSGFDEAPSFSSWSSSSSSWSFSSSSWSSSSQLKVVNVLLQPEETRALRVRFSPVAEHSVASLLILRNNLSVVEFLVLQGEGSGERVSLGGRQPGPGASLRFKMAEGHLRECHAHLRSNPKEPDFTLRRTFKMENTGRLPVTVVAMEIGGRSCQGFGFKVVDCREFTLQPNASRDILILFTPDFTVSRATRELRLSSSSGSRFSFWLNASVPYHLLATCDPAVPRPDWELPLYAFVSVVMSSMFLLVTAAAYLEALGIWEMFKTSMCLEASSDHVETENPFHFREPVPPPNNTQTNSKSARGGHTRGARPPGPLTLPGPKNPEGPLSSSQQTSRKSRSSTTSKPASSPGTLPAVSAPEQGSVLGLEERGYASMDKEPVRVDGESEVGFVCTPAATQKEANGTKGKTQRKAKGHRRQEEEGPKMKTETEDLKEDNAECSSIATETFHTDPEVSLKEDPSCRKRSGGHRSEPNGKSKSRKNREKIQTARATLELPYGTTLPKNQEASRFQTNPVKSQKARRKPVATSKVKVPCGILEARPSDSLLADFLCSDLSSSEGERDVSPPPEWEGGITGHRGHRGHRGQRALDSLQQISLQTMNADAFLRGSTGMPPLPPSPSSCSSSRSSSSSSSPFCSTSDLAVKSGAPGSKTKLTKSSSLPGRGPAPSDTPPLTLTSVSAGSHMALDPIQRPEWCHQSGCCYATCPPEGALWTVVRSSRNSAPLHRPNFNSHPRPIGTERHCRTASFPVFGPSNSCSLPEAFSGMSDQHNFLHQHPQHHHHHHPHHPHHPQQQWWMPEFSPPHSSTSSSSFFSSSSSSSTWPSETPLPQTLSSWSCCPSSSSSSSSNTSLLTPFSSSIWSADSAHLPTSSSSSLLIGRADSGSHAPMPVSGDQCPAYNPWSTWRPSFSRRSSEPWPHPFDSSSTN